MSFSGKVVVITGASDGIGAALARRLAPERPRLILAARALKGLEAVAQECRGLGAEAVAVRADVGLEADCKQLVDKAVENFGGLDILVNNAGITAHALFEEIEDFSIFERVMQVNFYGTLWCTRHALPHLRKSRGLLVGVSSLIGRTGVPSRSAYAASKWAVGGLFDCLRVELMDSGVEVCLVYPGVVATGIRQRGLDKAGQVMGASGLREEGAMSAEECARQMAEAIRARRRELLLTPRGKLIPWLRLFAPRLLDRLAAAVLKRRTEHEQNT
ncbi:MAG: SDR family oxidoreductase [Meiothermus sp.]|nr:SDR family oxidoreductase [Meiothermus sp.]